MESFLSKIKYLDINLSSKGIQLPEQVVLAYVLNNLTPAYEGLVTIITQSFRQNSDEMNTETLFSSLIDESRRQISAEKVLYSNKLKYKTILKFQNQSTVTNAKLLHMLQIVLGTRTQKRT